MATDFDGHPLVAPRALLDGSAKPYPSSVGTRAISGRVTAATLDRLQAISEALFSTDGTPPPADRIAWLRQELDDFLGRATLLVRLMFTFGSLIVSLVAPLLIGTFPPLGRLSLERRIMALEALERRSIATIFLGLRAILCLLYYEHPDAAAKAGIDAAGPPGGTLLPEEPT